MGTAPAPVQNPKESDRTQKPLHPSINFDFTPFHEPINRSPNISLTEIIENQQKVRQKRADPAAGACAHRAAPAQGPTLLTITQTKFGNRVHNI